MSVAGKKLAAKCNRSCPAFPAALNWLQVDNGIYRRWTLRLHM